MLSIGASAFAGLGVMILLIPLNAVVANATKKLQISEIKNKDKRVKMMNEILSGIKVSDHLRFVFKISFIDSLTRF